MLKNILSKLTLLAGIIRHYRTWRLAILDRYNLLHGTAIITLRNGTRYTVRGGASDIGKINSIYIRKDYHENLDRIGTGSIVIDIGAHIGVFSLFAVTMAKDVTVYSYEPSDENFSLLKQNVVLNNAQDNVHAFNMGVSGAGGRRKLFINRSNPGANSIVRETGESVIVETVSLKDIFDMNALERCDFLKMDSEGMEYEIFYSTREEYLARIKSIMMEYHDAEKMEDLVRFLRKNRFNVKFRKEKPYLAYAELK